MSEVLDRVRAKYPAYKDVPDDELTFRIGRTYPQYLDRNEEFASDFQRVMGESLTGDKPLPPLPVSNLVGERSYERAPEMGDVITPESLGVEPAPAPATPEEPAPKEALTPGADFVFTNKPDPWTAGKAEQFLPALFKPSEETKQMAASLKARRDELGQEEVLRRSREISTKYNAARSAAGSPEVLARLAMLEQNELMNIGIQPIGLDEPVAFSKLSPEEQRTLFGTGRGAGIAGAVQRGLVGAGEGFVQPETMGMLMPGSMGAGAKLVKEVYGAAFIPGMAKDAAEQAGAAIGYYSAGDTERGDEAAVNALTTGAMLAIPASRAGFEMPDLRKLAQSFKPEIGGGGLKPRAPVPPYPEGARAVGVGPERWTILTDEQRQGVLDRVAQLGQEPEMPTAAPPTTPVAPPIAPPVLQAPQPPTPTPAPAPPQEPRTIVNNPPPGGWLPSDLLPRGNETDVQYRQRQLDEWQKLADAGDPRATPEAIQQAQDRLQRVKPAEPVSGPKGPEPEGPQEVVLPPIGIVPDPDIVFPLKHDLATGGLMDYNGRPVEQIGDRLKLVQRPVDTGVPPAEPVGETIDERTGQPGESPPGVDVREPTGAGEEPAPAGETPPVPGRGEPERAPTGGTTGGGGPERTGGEGGGEPEHGGTSERPSDERQPPGAGGVEGTAGDTGEPLEPDREAINKAVAAARERLAHLYKSPNIEPMAAKYGLRSQEALERYEAAQRILNAKDLKDLEQYDYRTAEPLKFWAAEFRDRGFKFNAEVVRIAAEADALNRKGLEGELTDAERERMNSLYKQKLEMLAKMNPAVHKVGEEKDYYGMQYDEPRRVVITGTRFNDTSGRLYDIKDPQDPGIHYTGARDEQLFEPGARNPQHDLERAESRVRRAHATVANIGKWADLKSQGERQAYQRAKQESANAERELFNLRKELAGGKGKEPAAPELPSFPGPDRALARQGAIRRMINNYGNDVPGDKPTLTVDEAIAQEEADVRKLMAMPSWQPQDIEMATWVLHELRQLKQEGFTLPGKAAPPAPPAGPEPVNHVLPADQDFIPSGDKAKARANLDAIALLKKLEAEGRNPTPEEAKVLAQYTGWGGLQQVFDHGKAAYRERPPWAPEQKREFENWEKGWGKIYDEVKAALTTEEYAAAGKSILNAHYTSRDVINWIWKAVERLGFKGGKALEPAGGIGHFVGLTPESVRGKTRWTASELDSTSARIMAKLYPNARVHQMGFQDAKIAPNSQDLVVSNFPFEAKGPSDSRYPRMSLHNYFFARSLDLVKPGGLVAAITSDSTMDNTGASREAREYMAGKADLVGAIRLPNNAFKKNAGTEVTTDILFFRKRDGTPFKGEDFLRTGEYGSGKDKVEINEYYLKHPDMMLGRMGTEGTMRREGQQALTPIPGADLNRQLEEAVGKLPANVVTGSQPEADTGKGAYYTPKEITAKVGQLVHRGDEVLQYTENGELEKPDWAGDKKKVEQAKRYVSVRGITGELIRKMNDPNATEAEVTADRATLNKEYDAYVKKHGPLNGRASAFLDDDVDYPMALALEDPITKLVQEPGKKARRVTEWVKSKIFSERTIFPRVAPTSVDTVPDAVQVSQNFRGRIDPEYIAKLTNKPVEQVHQELTHSGLAFENPASGQWENRSTYLSGFVKKKLKEAVAAAQADPKYGPNVDALRKVQPEPIPLEQIGVKLGAVWVPPSVIERFVRDTLGVETKVNFTPATGDWSLAEGSGANGDRNRLTYGVRDWKGTDIVKEALNLKSPVVVDRVPDGDGGIKQVRNDKDTLEAREKQRQLQDQFKKFVLKDADTAAALEKIYNDQYNGVAEPKFEPPTWSQYPGASKDVTLRDHQKAVVTRILQNSTLLAHAVGTGKTYVMSTAAMEMRRLGLAKKPMIVVQNATIEQFGRAFKKLYPAARVLAPNAKMRDAKNRNRTMSRIATGDWDAVLVPQSFVNMLPDDPVREQGYISERVKELTTALIDAKREEGEKSIKAKDLQKAIDRLKERLDKLKNRATDNVLNFEQLGVDALFVDEAHEYKKLEFFTKMENLKGLDKGASQRAFSMFMKARWVQEHNQGRNLVFATGTPLSNTIAEAWNMMRFVRPDVLKAYNMEKFDDFASTFGNIATRDELTPVGDYKPVTRFAEFQNGPELISAWRTVADVVTADQVKLPTPPLKNGKVTAHTIPQTEVLAAYIQKLRKDLADFAAMTGREKRDNSHIPLVTYGRARKSTLDMRMIDPSLPDQPNSKLNVAADVAARAYHESRSVKGTQMMFADLFQDNPDNPQFNLYTELKKKLIERGVPEDMVTIMGPEMKDARRDALFAKMKTGDMGVLIGGTSRMGVGVDVPEHMVALHHLDVPQRPMDVEQRNGRILRQGNQNAEVEIHSYGVDGSLDAAMYDTLASKQRFINQIMRGDIQGRNFEDAANEITMSYEEQMAAYSGDKRLRQKVSLTNQVRTLESLRSSHYDQVARARNRIADLTARIIPAATAEVTRADTARDTLTKAFDGEAEPVLNLEGAEVRGRKAVVARLDELFQRLKDESREKAKTRKDFGNQESREVTANVNGVDFKFKGLTPIDAEGKAQPDNARIDWAFGTPGMRHPGGYAQGGSGFFTSLSAAIESVGKAPERARDELKSAAKDLQELKGLVTQPFDREAELGVARQKLAELEAELRGPQAGPAEPGEGELEYPGGELPRETGLGEREIPPGAEDMVVHNMGTAQRIVRNIKQARALVAPQSVKDVAGSARFAANVLRELGSKMANEMARADQGLARYRRSFDRTPVPKKWKYDPTLGLPRNYAFIDAYETGNTASLSPGEQLAAQEMGRQNQEWVQRVRALGGNALQTLVQNYFPHLWEDPAKAQEVIGQLLNKRPLEGPKGFTKARTYDFFREGLDAGLKPVHDNPVDLWLLKKREVERFILGHEFVNQMKAEGLLKFVHVFSQAPKGYTRVNDRAFEVYGPPFVKIKEAFDANMRAQFLDLLQSLGVPYERQVAIGGKRWGYEAHPMGTQGQERIVAKFGGPEDINWHELGHVLDNRYSDFRNIVLGPAAERRQVAGYRMRKQQVPTHLQRTAALDAEVRALADLRVEGAPTPPTAGYKKYVRSTPEKMAAVIQAYMHMPERMGKVAPTVKGAFEQFIGNHPELERIKTIQPGLRLGEAQAQVPVGGLVKIGNWYMPDTAAKVMNNYLSPGLNPQMWYRGLRQTSNLLNGVQLGLSAFHLGFTSLDAATSRMAVAIEDAMHGEFLSAVRTLGSVPAAPLTNILHGRKLMKEVLKPGTTDPQTAELVKALEAGGGRIGQDRFWKTEFTRRMTRALNEGTATGWLKGAVAAPFALFEQSLRPIMEYIVPRQKLGVFADMAKRELLKLPPGSDGADVREVMRKAWDSVDNRMGQLVYDNLFYNRAVKDLALLSFRAYGWQLGKYREGLGATADTATALKQLAMGRKPEFTHRMAYAMALPVMVGLLGGITHYLMTGQQPQGQDWFMPRTGEKDRNGNDVRLNLPSYVKDVIAYSKHPLTSFGHSLNPLGSAIMDLLNNRDFYDVRIRNPADPLTKQGSDVAQFAAKQFIPFSVSGAMKLRQDEAPLRKQLLPFIGVTPAPARLAMSPAQELAAELMADRMPAGPRTKEQFDRSELIKEIVQDVQRGKGPEAGQKAMAGLQAGTLTAGSFTTMVDKLRYNPMQFQVHTFDTESAMQVWRVASPVERGQLTPIVVTKIVNSKTLSLEQKVGYLREIAGKR